MAEKKWYNIFLYIEGQTKGEFAEKVLLAKVSSKGNAWTVREAMAKVYNKDCWKLAIE